MKTPSTSTHQRWSNTRPLISNVTTTDALQRGGWGRGREQSVGGGRPPYRSLPLKGGGFTPSVQAFTQRGGQSQVCLALQHPTAGELSLPSPAGNVRGGFCRFSTRCPFLHPAAQQQSSDLSCSRERRVPTERNLANCLCFSFLFSCSRASRSFQKARALQEQHWVAHVFNMANE